MIKGFGIRLLNARTERGLTQAKLAKAVHIGRQTVGMYERDQRLPDADILVGLVKALDCDLYWLLGLERPNMEPVVNAKWAYYTNDEGRARWRCGNCGKICRRDPHDKKRCSSCGAHMSGEA